MDGGFALPWAHPDAVGSSCEAKASSATGKRDADTTDLEAQPERKAQRAEEPVGETPEGTQVDDESELKTLGIALGSRIEVRWVIEEDDAETGTETETVHWWGCALTTVEVKRTFEGKRVWKLIYDAKDAFEACSVEVTFKDGKELFDLEQKTALRWRKEGETAQSEEEGEEEEDLNRTYSAREIIEAQEEVEREERGEDDPGASYEELGMQALSELPTQQQHVLAAGFRNLSDFLKNKLQELQETRGADMVVSKEDVDDIMASFRQASG
ncbi:hypothetical protein CYMTET_13657 [Cymbomonas tetramitiformis]|uniref:Uncharacterized protein n=1 Tax=Cymbomonas tetramitiformis TaxID=36881 RepID=A0AAE0L6S9_9CHLO|nr:hypothetical protein CYMTET_17803 [Cymbomonas tetramitiformis]KAK3278406.1 hypothetical protein CYMTET_13657 [Cymbomonas tetramitiformis]